MKFHNFVTALCLRPLAEPLYSIEEKRLMLAKEHELAIEVTSRPRKIPRLWDGDCYYLEAIYVLNFDHWRKSMCSATMLALLMQAILVTLYNDAHLTCSKS